MEIKNSPFQKHIAIYVLNITDGDLEDAVQELYRLMKYKYIKKFIIRDQQFEIKVMQTQ